MSHFRIALDENNSDRWTISELSNSFGRRIFMMHKEQRNAITTTIARKMINWVGYEDGTIGDSIGEIFLNRWGACYKNYAEAGA